MNGQPVHTAGDVSSRVGLATPGERLALTVWRDKASREISVVLGKAQGDHEETVAKADGESLGLSVRPLDRGDLHRAGVDHGLLVEGASGPAADAGISAGDVLLALNGKPVNSVEQVREVLRKHPRHVALLIQRDGEQIFVPVDLG